MEERKRPENYAEDSDCDGVVSGGGRSYAQFHRAGTGLGWRKRLKAIDRLA